MFGDIKATCIDTRGNKLRNNRTFGIFPEIPKLNVMFSLTTDSDNDID